MLPISPKKKTNLNYYLAIIMLILNVATIVIITVLVRLIARKIYKIIIIFYT